MEQTPQHPDEPAWLDLRQQLDEAQRRQVQALVDAEAHALAELFLQRVRTDRAVAPGLDHDAADRHLLEAVVRWLRTLFDPAVAVAQLIALQRQIGELHARIGVAPRTVAAAGRGLQRAIAGRVLAAPHGTTRQVQYVYELVDLATDTMSGSLLAHHVRLARSDESCRLHHLSRNLRTERERQRSQLLEWLQDLLVQHYWNANPAAAAGELPSAFEQWLRHQAGLLFAHEPELAALREGVERVRRALLPRLREARFARRDAGPLVGELHRAGEQMKAWLAALFDRAAAADEGRDDITPLLSRRYLPAIARREIALAQAGGLPFALLLLAIDGFDEIRHALGADGGDRVLAQVAAAVVEQIRLSDFAFRAGDERLLLLLVDTAGADAMRIAHEIHRHVEALAVRTGAGIAPCLAARIGVAPFDGHPDYQHLLERADTALRTCGAAPHLRVMQAA